MRARLLGHGLAESDHAGHGNLAHVPDDPDADGQLFGLSLDEHGADVWR
jgi:hypothetical protein